MSLGLQLFTNRLNINGLSLFKQSAVSLPDPAVVMDVKITSVDELGDIKIFFRIDQDRAQNGLFRFPAVWDLVDLLRGSEVHIIGDEVEIIHFHGQQPLVILEIGEKI